MWRDRSRRMATSVPSTRYTRGSPPGLLRATVTSRPGTKPRFMRCSATGGESSKSARMAFSPTRRSARALAGRLGCFLRRPNMKLKIIFNSNFILTLSRRSATTKVTLVCDARTWGNPMSGGPENGPASSLARPASASARLHPDLERLNGSDVVFPGAAVFQGERCHPRGNGPQPELLRDRGTHNMAVLAILLRRTLHQSERRWVAFDRP